MIKRETKNTRLDIKQLSEDGSFEGIACVYESLDLGMDIVEKGAFRKSLKDRGSVPILWQHDERSPIGIGELTDSKDGLLIKGKLTLGVAQAAEAYALLKDGVISGLSIGFQTVKDEVKSGVRYLKEIKLWEVSVVTFPMQPDAQVVAVKAAGEAKDFDKELSKIRAMASQHQTMMALYNSLDVIAYHTDMTIEDRVSESGESIDQFKAAYLEALPAFLEGVDTMMRWGNAEKLEFKAGRRLSAATRASLEKVREDIKALLEADDQASDEQKGVNSNRRATFKVGDKVKITKPHMGMKAGDKGTITEVSAETPYAVKMDDASMGSADHKWYVASEMEAAPNASAQDSGEGKAADVGAALKQLASEIRSTLAA